MTGSQLITADNISPDEFNPLKSDNPAVIYQDFHEIRTRCPLGYTSQYGGYWQLTKHEDVKRSAEDGSNFISSVKAVVPGDPRGLRRPPLSHTPFRRALDRTLKPMRLKKLQPLIEQQAERELASFIAAAGGDICQQFGARYPAWIEKEWLNLDDEVAKSLAKTAASMAAAWRALGHATIVACSQNLWKVTTDLVHDRQRNPRQVDEDPVSSLLSVVDENGNRLDEESVVAAIEQSLVVGMVAPPLIFGAICNHLSEDQKLQATLLENLDLVPAAVEEFIRLYMPYRGFARSFKDPTAMYGKLIRLAKAVVLNYSAANRDPTVFANPDEFRMDRLNMTSHLGFGRGRHRCAGMPLARMMIQIALKLLLRSTKGSHVNGPLDYARMPEVGITSCALHLAL